MRTKLGVAALVAAMVLPGATTAAILNPDFEAGLASWTATGDFSLENGTYGPTNRLVLTSETAGQNPLGAGAVDLATILGATGMDATTLDATEPAGFDGFTGSALSQNFNYNSGVPGQVNFDWQLFTDETLWGGGTPFPDYVLVRVFDGAGFDVYELVGDIRTEFNAGNLVASPTQYDTESAINNFTLTTPLPGPGNYTLQVVMFDVVDDAFSSAVSLDNFTMVLEGPSLALCVAGVLGLVVAGRRNPARKC